MFIAVAYLATPAPPAAGQNSFEEYTLIRSALQIWPQINPFTRSRHDRHVLTTFTTDLFLLRVLLMSCMLASKRSSILIPTIQPTSASIFVPHKQKLESTHFNAGWKEQDTCVCRTSCVSVASVTTALFQSPSLYHKVITWLERAQSVRLGVMITERKYNYIVTVYWLDKLETQ